MINEAMHGMGNTNYHMAAWFLVGFAAAMFAYAIIKTVFKSRTKNDQR